MWFRSEFEDIVVEGRDCFYGSEVSPGGLQQSPDDFALFCDVEAFRVVSGDIRDVQRKENKGKI